MRAFAICVVVAFHGSFPGFEGGFIGVDVFFVISGFLITGVLLTETEQHGRIRLGRFWARRIRRLLPASTVVVLATMAATVALLSPIAWQSTAESGVWAAAYGENLFLAIDEANYFAPETRNPFVHFWSLAIEEQFYVAWPLLMVALTAAAAKLQRAAVLPAGLALVGIASFIHSLTLTDSGSTWAYYSPLSRAWEFAAGGLLALAAPAIARHRTVVASHAATAAGVALLGYSLWTLNGFTPFPGWRAVPPVLGTSLLVAAHNGPRTPVGRLLDLPPVQWIGRLSYGWYLWHFPFLVIAEQYAQSFGPVRRIVVIAASLGVAALSYHLIENPVRFSSRLRDRHGANYLLALGLLGLSLAAAGIAHATADTRLDDPKFVELQAAAADFEQIADQGCPAGASGETLITSCVWGDAGGSRTLLVLGDSHADQWIPALDLIGQQNGVRVIVRTSVACPALPSGPPGSFSGPCVATQLSQLDEIDTLKPDAVFVTQWTGSFGAFDETKWRESLAEFGAGLQGRDIGLFWMHDPASFDTNPIDCLGIRSADACTPDRFTSVADTAFHAAIVREALAGSDFIEFDPSAILCDERRCPLRFQGELVYRDSNHLTGTVAELLAPEIEPDLLTALGAP